jgi:CRP/FNR family transcriptional regulator, cyclic AMP receptor protein
MSKTHVFSKGALLIREGSCQRNAYIIEKGRVEVSKRDEKGNKRVIAICGKNEVVGEMTLLNGGTRCATITALDDCEVSVIKYENFKYLPDSDHRVETLRKVMDNRRKVETGKQGAVL